MSEEKGDHSLQVKDTEYYLYLYDINGLINEN